MRTAPVRRRRWFTRPDPSGPRTPVSTLLCPRVLSRPKRHVGSDQCNSREQSCAGGTAQRRGLRGAFLHVHGPHRRQAGVRGPRHPPGRPPTTFRRTAAQARRTPRILPRPTRIPCTSAVFRPWGTLKRALGDHPGVAVRFRRVVVARRCAQHHLRRVMVEPPPRAGPSPPHGPARFCVPPQPLGEWRCGGGRLSPPGTATWTGSARCTPGPRRPIASEGLTIT